MIQWVKGLLCKHEDLNLDPEHLPQNLAMVADVVISAPQSRDRKIPGACLIKPV